MEEIMTNGLSCRPSNSYITVESQPGFPRTVPEVLETSELLTEFGPDVDPAHPGHTDEAYRTRRKQLLKMAADYKWGKPLPAVTYTSTEIDTWGKVYDCLVSMHSHVCQANIDAFQYMEREFGYCHQRIPQLEEISKFINDRTGFQLILCKGFITNSNFLAGAAMRVFPCSLHVRHHSTPLHTFEPDCVHELLAHVPLMANPKYADLTHELGLASLGASTEDIERLGAIYWYMLEYGLCREGDQVRAVGASLLTNASELEYALSDKAVRKPFDPATVGLEWYAHHECKPVYYVAESFDDVISKIRCFIATIMIKKKNMWRYDSTTHSIIDSKVDYEQRD